MIVIKPFLILWVMCSTSIKKGKILTDVLRVIVNNSF